MESRWADLIEAVLRLPLDPTQADVRERLATLRVRIIALVDALPKWTGLDEWLSAEHGLGAAIGRHVLQSSHSRMSEKSYVEALMPYMTWSMRLSQNLRHLHNTGYAPDELRALRESAIQGIRQVYARNGWGEPELSVDLSQLGL